MVLLTLAIRDLVDGVDLDEFAGLEPSEVVPATIILALFIGATYGAMGVLAALAYLGRARPRVWLLTMTAVSMISTEYGRFTFDAEHDTFLGGYPVLAVNVLVLLLLSSMDTRTWTRRTEMDRRRRRAELRAFKREQRRGLLRSGRRALPLSSSSSSLSGESAGAPAGDPR